jgi:ISXO2-like transposase domain
MQESNLPFRYWFIAIHLLTGTKKTFPAPVLQRQIGHKFYEPIWYIWCHIPHNARLKDAQKVLPWVYTMISNAKRTLLGVHHIISIKYAQNYLDEFCHKVNRRNFGEQLFDRLLISCKTTNYHNVIDHNR